MLPPSTGVRKLQEAGDAGGDPAEGEGSWEIVKGSEGR